MNNITFFKNNNSRSKLIKLNPIQNNSHIPQKKTNIQFFNNNNNNNNKNNHSNHSDHSNHSINQNGQNGNKNTQINYTNHLNNVNKNKNMVFIKQSTSVKPVYINNLEFFGKESAKTTITGSAIKNPSSSASASALDKEKITHVSNDNNNDNDDISSIVVRNDVFPHNMCLGTGQDGIIKISGISSDGSGSCYINGKLVLPSPKVPSSSYDSGIAGQIAWDEDYVYVCISLNTWKRSIISQW